MNGSMLRARWVSEAFWANAAVKFLQNNEALRTNIRLKGNTITLY
jgi:hypothetical protein